MRIAIDYRVMSTEAADRGMGRYTQQQLREVLKRDKENDYLVLCYPNVKKSLIYPEIRNAPNVQIRQLDFPEIDNKYLVLSLEKTLSFSAKLQDFLYKERIDLFHATTPFLNPVISDFDVCPLVSTLYDLIPLIYPGHYLKNPPGLDEQYTMALRFLLNSERLISISKSASEDAYRYLGYDKNKVDLAYPIVDEKFEIHPKAQVAKTIGKLRKRAHIPDQYILSVTGIHHSKNASSLFTAFKNLPQSIQNQLPLLVVLPNEYAHQVIKDSYGSLPNVFLTYSVTDEELVALYNSATMVIQPSRYEGFGYPVVEAMKCGAPVITTTTSSLPEAGGNAAILVEPDDVDGLRDAITTLFYNPEHRQVMRELGLVQANRFSLEQLGNNTLGCYQKVLNRSTDASNDRKHIAVWSSFPPQKCGVADYTVELVEQLSASCSVEVFVDSDYLPSEHLNPSYKIHHYSAFERRNSQKRFETVIYQMGSTFFQTFMYDALEQHPGIVVFHDLIMGLGYFSTYNSKNLLEKFKIKMLAPEGKGVIKEFDEIMDATKETPLPELEAFFQKHYSLQWIFNNSVAQIVHMQYAQNELENRYTDTNVHVVHMGVADPRLNRSINSRPLRIQYGISPNQFVIGIFGSVVPVKRIEACLRALKNLVLVHPDALLLIVGNQPISQYSATLNDLVKQLQLEAHVIFADHTSRKNFDNLFLLSDVILNLRYPTYKGMSAILIRAFAAGKPAIISNIPEWSDFPEQFCFRVDPDESEVNSLSEILIRLAGDSQFTKNASQQARKYFEQNATQRHMAAQYMDLINRITTRKEQH